MAFQNLKTGNHPRFGTFRNILKYYSPMIQRETPSTWMASAVCLQDLCLGLRPPAVSKVLQNLLFHCRLRHHHSRPRRQHWIQREQLACKRKSRPCPRQQMTHHRLIPNHCLSLCLQAILLSLRPGRSGRWLSRSPNLVPPTQVHCRPRRALKHSTKRCPQLSPQRYPVQQVSIAGPLVDPLAPSAAPIPAWSVRTGSQTSCRCVESTPAGRFFSRPPARATRPHRLPARARRTSRLKPCTQTASTVTKTAATSHSLQALAETLTLALFPPSMNSLRSLMAKRAVTHAGAGQDEGTASTQRTASAPAVWTVAWACWMAPPIRRSSTEIGARQWNTS